MADRPAGGSIVRAVAPAVAAAVVLSACGGAARPSAGDAGRRAVVRVSARHLVHFSIVAACRRHPLRAFPDRPPRLGRDGGFTYRERGRAYRLTVSGRVRGRSARGSLALAGRPRRGPPCRTRVSWRAARR